MTSLDFTWQTTRFSARPSGALWWPARRWLIVADLHLGKSERIARRGGTLLPPYEGIETLRRLEDEIRALDPAAVVSLGDAFDDDHAAAVLDPVLRETLSRLAQGRQWLWVSGNHDPAPLSGDTSRALPGLFVPDIDAGGFTLRHIPAVPQPDISGHFHPVVRLAGTRRRAFLVGEQHLILPAFGSYTGGLSADDPAIRQWTPRGIAIACAHRAIAVPLGG